MKISELLGKIDQKGVPVLCWSTFWLTLVSEAIFDGNDVVINADW